MPLVFRGVHEAYVMHVIAGVQPAAADIVEQSILPSSRIAALATLAAASALSRPAAKASPWWPKELTTADTSSTSATGREATATSAPSLG